MDKKQIFLILGIAVLLIGIPVAIILVSNPTGLKIGASGSGKAENVSVSNVTSQGAMVTWSTTSASQGGVSYGISANSLTLFKPETASTVNHTISLDSLLAGTKYYFVIKVGSQTYYNDDGQPYSFTTTAAKPTPSPLPTATPTTAAASLTEEGFLSAMGTTNPTYDLNKDGIVNILDLQVFRAQQLK